MNPPERRLTAAQAESLAASSEPWFSCDDCFEYIDSYVEALVRDGRQLDEAFRVHLIMCAACREEAESLIALTAHDRDADTDQVLAAFHAQLGAHSDIGVERKGGMSRLFRRRKDNAGP